MTQNSTNEKWHEICFLLSESIDSFIDEKKFENQVLRAIEILGWREFRGEIQRQPTFQFGSQGTLRPDFIICNQENKTLIAVEVKRPSEELTGSGMSQQLWSYMRQLKADFGFLIGKEIRIYYDGSLNQQNDPILLEKILFDRHSLIGNTFIEQFNKDSFLKENYQQYLQEKITKFSIEREKKKLIGILLSNATKQKIDQFLEKEFSDFGAEVFSTAIKSVSVKVRRSRTADPFGSNNVKNGGTPKQFTTPIQLWGKTLSPKIVPTNSNIKTALTRLLDGDNLKSWEKRHVKELGAENWLKDMLRSIIDDPGGYECQKILEDYKHKFNKSQDHNDIPKCIRNTFIVGYFARSSKTRQKPKEFIRWALKNGFGNKENSAGACYQVGSTAGKTFGLLDNENFPTKLFLSYFEV